MRLIHLLFIITSPLFFGKAIGEQRSFLTAALMFSTGNDDVLLYLIEEIRKLQVWFLGK
jgi:hypothetical protein